MFQNTFGDRGNIVVPVPAPVVPYVPNLVTPSSDMDPVTVGNKEQNLMEAIWPEHGQYGEDINSIWPSHSMNVNPSKPVVRRKQSNSNSGSSADFSDFELLEKEKEVDNRPVIESYVETDRIDVPNKPLIFDLTVGATMGGGSSSKDGGYRIAVGSVGDPEPAYVDQIDMDPNSLAYNLQSAPYGQQYPSFVPDTLSTTLGTDNGPVKQFDVGSDVVYGSGSVGGDVSLDEIRKSFGLENLSDDEMVMLLQEVEASTKPDYDQEYY